MRKDSTCKVDNQGRITLPAEWRREQGIEAGTEVFLRPGEFGLTVQTLTLSVREAQAIVKRYAKGSGSMVDDLIAMRRREARLEEAKARRWLGKRVRQLSSDRTGKR